MKRKFTEDPLTRIRRANPTLARALQEGLRNPQGRTSDATMRALVRSTQRLLARGEKAWNNAATHRPARSRGR